MLVIDLRNKRILSRFSYSVVGNKDSDVIIFYSHFVQYANSNIYLKVENDKYVDKIAIPQDKIHVEDNTLVVEWTMTKEACYGERLFLQLQFEENGEIAQSSIATVTLGNTINASEQVAKCYPRVLEYLQEQLDLLKNGSVATLEIGFESDTLTITTKNAKNVVLDTLTTTIPLSDKVDKVEGMGLTHNDFTDALLEKLENIENGAQVNLLEGVKVDGTDLPIGNDKKVNIVLTGKVNTTNSHNKVYATDNSGNQTTLDVDNGTGYGGNIARRDVNGQVHVPLTPTANNHATSKKYVDEKIADIQRDAYKPVDITEYPTLNDFLASTGEEGYLYLYPIDTTEAPTFESGFYRYIWEDNAWVDLGTTKIDLSDYYNKTQVDALLDTKADKSTTYTKTQVDNLLADKPTIFLTYDITELTVEFLEATKLGDIIVEGDRQYVVAFKNNSNISLIHCNEDVISSVNYAWQNQTWEYVGWGHVDFTQMPHIRSFDVIEDLLDFNAWNDANIGDIFKIEAHSDDKGFMYQNMIGDMDSNNYILTSYDENIIVTYNRSRQSWSYKITKNPRVMFSVTYYDLKKMRDNGELVAGAQYRIIDYDCSTIQANTRSAMHPFDVIVTADDESHLNENARACHSARDSFHTIVSNSMGSSYEREPNADGYYQDERYYAFVSHGVSHDNYVYVKSLDVLPSATDVYIFEDSQDSFINIIEASPTSVTTFDYLGETIDDCEGKLYFVNSKVEAWELKYCLDNDSDRFAWATETIITNIESAFSNGRPLTRQPSFDNQNPSPYQEYQYAWGTEEDVEDTDNSNFIYSKNETLRNGEEVCVAHNNQIQVAEVIVGKGVIYYMKDEFNNECHYDFKNIQFARYKVTACANCTSLVNKYVGVKDFSGNAILTNRMTIDDNDYKYFYTFDCCGVDYSLNAIGTTLTRPDQSTFTLNQIQCFECLIVSCTNDTEKYYLNNIVLMLESGRDYNLKITGMDSQNSTLLGGATSLIIGTLEKSIVGSTGTSFIDGYVGQFSKVDYVMNSLVCVDGGVFSTIHVSNVKVINESLITSHTNHTFENSTIGNIYDCVLKANIRVAYVSTINGLQRSNLSANTIFTFSKIGFMSSCNGEATTSFVGYSNLVYIYGLTPVVENNTLANHFILYCNITLAYAVSCKSLNYVNAMYLRDCNLNAVTICNFTSARGITCAQELKNCNFHNQVEYVTISSTNTSQIISNTNFHNIRGEQGNIKNIVLNEDYSVEHQVDVYTINHSIVEV